MNIQIANRLVALRKANGYSQEELAAKLGISRQAVSKWEQAQSCPDTDNLICLSKLYHISLDELLLAEENEKELYPAPKEKEGDSTEGENIGQPGEEQAEDAGKEKTEETAEETFFSEEREVYESDDGSRVETRRNGDTVTVTVTDAQGRSVTVTEEGGKKSLHFDGLDPNDPDTEALLKKFRIGNTETPDGNGMEEPLESFDGVPEKKIKNKRRIGWLAGSYPVLCALIYLFLGFVWNLWHPGWIVFLTIPIYYAFEGCRYTVGSMKTALKAAWPVCCLVIFLVLGSIWGLWHPGWLIFLTVPIIETL